MTRCPNARRTWVIKPVPAPTSTTSSGSVPKAHTKASDGNDGR